MQVGCIAALKEGLEWEDAHILAHTIAIDGLLSIGLLQGDPQKILEARTSAAFMPHGLGHFLGMDTHDVGGKPTKDETDPLFKYLRIRRSLPAGSVVTVEPGVRILQEHGLSTRFQTQLTLILASLLSSCYPTLP